MFDAMSLEERMTVCNMAIEGGARCGYVNPDETTFEYLRGRPHAPEGDAFERAQQAWREIASSTDAEYDDHIEMAASDIAPSVTWGINPGQNAGVNESIPAATDLPESERPQLEEALEAAVEDASKLFRSRWPRSGLAGSDFNRSRSATTRGQ